MGKASHLIVVAWCLMILAAVAAIAQPAELPDVNINATDISLEQFLGKVSAQTGVETYLAEDPGIEVSVDLVDADIETAIHTAAEQANCSWLRIYVLESLERPAEEEDFGTLARLVTETRSQYFRRMTREEREALAAEVAAMVQAGSNAQDETPIGGWRASAISEEAQAGGLDRSAQWAMSDPLRFATSPSYSDPASLQIADADVAAFSDALADASGFVVLDRLQATEGQIDLEFTEVAVDEIVTAAAEQLGCSWRRVYLLAHVRKLSNEEIEQRMDTVFNASMGYFWSQPQERRAEVIQRIVDGSNQLTEGQRAQIRSSEMARKMMQRFMNHSNTLSMEQRRELTPLLQAAAKIMGG